MCEKRERNRERDYAKSRGGVGLESAYQAFISGVVSGHDITGGHALLGRDWEVSAGNLDAPIAIPAGGVERFAGLVIQAAVTRRGA